MGRDKTIGVVRDDVNVYQWNTNSLQMGYTVPYDALQHIDEIELWNYNQGQLECIDIEEDQPNVDGLLH